MGIDTSFVVAPDGDKVNLSARSMGDTNVQVILEKLGGGGHFTVSGAQLKDCSAEEAKERVRSAIDEYLKEERHEDDLLQDVKSVGKKGDLINASEGYAKNFLLPRKLAVEATKSNLNDYELKQKAEAKRKQEELEKAQATAKELRIRLLPLR